MALNNSVNFVLQGQVGTGGSGPQVSDGGNAQGRFGRQSDLIVSELQGRYYEQTKRGNKFSFNSPATTTGIAALHLLGAAAAAAGQFALINPVNSGKDLVLTKLGISIISGTVPAGPVWHALFPAAGVVVAKNNTIVNNYGNGGVGSVAVDFNHAASTALAGTGAPVPIRQSVVDLSAGTFADLAGTNGLEVIDGDIIVPPGVGWTLQWSGAGTSVLNYYSLTWDEVPV